MSVCRKRFLSRPSPVSRGENSKTRLATKLIQLHCKTETLMKMRKDVELRLIRAKFCKIVLNIIIWCTSALPLSIVLCALAIDRHTYNPQKKKPKAQTCTPNTHTHTYRQPHTPTPTNQPTNTKTNPRSKATATDTRNPSHHSKLVFPPAQGKGRASSSIPIVNLLSI